MSDVYHRPVFPPINRLATLQESSPEVLCSSWHGAHCPDYLLLDSDLSFRLNPLRLVHSRRRFLLQMQEVGGQERPIGKVSRRLTHNASVVSTFAISKALPAHGGCVNSINLDTTGELLVSGSDDLKVCVHDTTSFELLRYYHTKHRSNIFHASFAPFHREHILTCALDGMVIVLDTETGEHFYKSKQSSMASDIVTSTAWPQTAYVAGGDGHVIRVDTRCKPDTPSFAGSPLPGFVRSVNALAHHPRFPHTIASATNTPFVYLHDVRMGSLRSYAALAACEPSDELYLSSGIGGISFSEGGDWLAVNHREDEVYLVPWKENVESAHAGTNWVSEIIGSPLCSVPAIPCRGVKTLYGRQNQITMFKQVAWLEDDTIVCTGGDDGNIYFWDTHSGALLHTTKGDEDVVNGVLGHPGGGTLYACGIDSTIKVLRPATTVTAETEERRLKTYHQAAAAHVAEHVRAPGFGMSAAQFMEMLLTGPQSGSGESSSSSAEDSQGGAAESSPMTSLASSSEEEEGASPHLDPMYFCLRSAQAFTGCLRRSALFQTKLLLAVQEHTSLQQLKIIRSHLAMQSDLVDSDLSTPESGEEEEEEDEPSEFPARVVLDAITTETESEGGDDVASEETPEEESASDGGLLRDAEPSDWGQVLSLVTSLIEPANQDTEDSTSEETTTSSTSSPVYDDDDAYDSDGVSSGREGRGARVTRASVTAMMDRLYTTPEADTQFIAMSAALLRLSEQLEKRLLAWKLPPCCVKDGDDMVQHFNWEKCTYGRFAMAKQQTSTASDDPLDTDRIAQMQRCDEQAQYIKLLLDFMSLLLEGKEPLYKNESLKQEYWGKVAWLHKQYVYYFMAMGEAANACQYAEQLEEWVELASMESLESILVKPKPKGGRPKKRTRQAAEEHADPNEPDPSSPDPRCWRQMPVTFEDHSADAVCCWYPKLLIPLYLQIKIITAVCAQTSPSPEVHMAYPLLRTERRLDRMEMPLRPYHGVSDNEKETQPRLRQLKRELCEELRTRLVSHPVRGIASRMKKSLSRLEKEEPLDS